ncbi:hypothetical protein LEN26_009186 [Aphanomyces euteiches]|nr:hypothetical protein LEN26_009186 [Aphanomyces euteiches]
MEHETWTLCDLLPGRKPIGCRWLFTKKYSADGFFLRYKARLVAQGFTQVAGIDCTDIFAPVIRTSSIRFLLALAALQSMQICHMDVQTALLNGALQETLYMRQPPGYVKPGQDHLVCRLNKSFYGLKQYYDNSSRYSLYKHQQIAKRVLRYLKGAQDYCLLYSKSDKEDFTIDPYVDADYANDISTRQSTSGFLLFLNGCLISWKSKLQNIVALSTCEAEYISMSYGPQEALWLKYLLEELQLVIKLPINVYEDNQSTIKMAENPTLQQRTKHSDVRHHFIRDLVKQRIIKINYCQTNSMLADILTKALPKPKFEEHMPKLVTSIPPSNNEETSR